MTETRVIILRRYSPELVSFSLRKIFPPPIGAVCGQKLSSEGASLFSCYKRMSGAPSSSRRPQSVVRLPSRSSAQNTSSGSSYRLSREDTLVRTSIAASSQHTDPRENSTRRLSRWVTSSDRGTKGESSGNVRWTLNYSTAVGSHANNSERIILELRR